MYLSAVVFLHCLVLVSGSLGLVDENCGIFCDSGLLHAIQTSSLFNDSKHFVDMPLRSDPDVMMNEFRQLGQSQSDRDTLKAFVDRHFSAPGTELVSCHFKDWHSHGRQFSNVLDASLRQWASHIHGKWRTLCRKVHPKVHQQKNRYTSIFVPHPFVIPGGRFRELYYWDTYWIVRGLLVSEMYGTARGHILNMVHLVNRFGFIPNGARTYYLSRSQPPMLTPMVYDYIKASNDSTFLAKVLPALDREQAFWDQRRSVSYAALDGQVYNLYQYRAEQNQPRPESFKEDLETAHSHEDKPRVYADIASACESGWDFSSRWFGSNAEKRLQLSSIRTTRILPVDLNAIMQWNNRQLAELHTLNGDPNLAHIYRRRSKELSRALNRLFWNDRAGIWQDVDLEDNTHLEPFYASSIVPLYTLERLEEHQVVRIMDYLKTIGIGHGGLPTSHFHSGQQWDGANGWPPLNHMAIMGLSQSGFKDAVDMAADLAQRWLSMNYAAFHHLPNQGMYEKYNVADVERPIGHGGEYEVQEGFGWTNGVALDLLQTFGHRLAAPLLVPVIAVRAVHTVTA